jgi:hypothetical protein
VARSEEDIAPKRVWRQRVVWKLACPLKTKIIWWLALANILLTWDNSKKRNWVGPNRCILCKNSEEFVHRLFMNYTQAKIVWKEVAQAYVGLNEWNKMTMVD